MSSLILAMLLQTVTGETNRLQPDWRVVAHMRALNISDRPIELWAVPFDQLPVASGREGIVTAAAFRVEERCVVKFGLGAYESDDRLVAHEICHCALDWNDMGIWGFAANVPKEEVPLRETRADRCAAWLLSDTKEAKLQRARQAAPFGRYRP